MRKGLILILLFSLSVGLLLIGCTAKKTASSTEAINTAKTMETVEQKVDYLLGQARAFYNTKEFQQAVDIAKYVLANLDKDSQAAKDLLEKAKNALMSAAQSAVTDVKSKLALPGQ